MPAKDKYHDIVISALQKDGWTIDSEQVTLHVGERRLWIDLRARNQERDIILVEVKSYENLNSPVLFLQQALGQYLMYRAILEENNPPERLYLAVPEQANIEIIQSNLGQLIIARYKVDLIVYDLKREEILEWNHNS